MSYKVKDDVTLKVCTDQVEAIITAPRFRGTTWTRESLKAHLNYIGIQYSYARLDQIITELISRKILEEE